jgi:L-ascorbate metabolism protein UlaG (beta-lactamase superfamily)
MRRRTLVGGVGLAGVAGMAAAAYRTAPAFWKQFSKEWGREIVPSPCTPAPAQWPDRGLYAAWLGHTTVLLKIDGTTILTDPVFSDRIGLNFGPMTLGLKRLVKPAMSLRQLPKIDLILLSHAHMDHFDLPSLRTLESRGTQVVTATRTSDLLRIGRYARVRELGWNQRAQAGPVALRAFEVNHWGARMRNDTWRGYNGYVIEAGRYRVVFAGDTAITSTFRGLRESRPFDLALMPVGAYNPWIRVHCAPEQAWQMANDAGAEFVLPVHHQTFQLSREPRTEPIERLYRAAGADQHRVATQEIGQEFKIHS